MPNYDYACTNTKCNHTMEVNQSFKDEPLKTCPVCGEQTLKKLISGSRGLIFKGSGFYETDYKRKS